MRVAWLAAVAVTAVLVVASPSAASAARAYGAAGPKAVAVKTLTGTTTRLVSPTSGGPYPLVVASHGFSASGDNQLGWAQHFASWGLAVAVPSFPSPLAPDAAKDAAIIEDLVTQLRGPLAAAERVSTGAFGLEGHSAGGLATAVAALQIAPGATILFDPVDKDAVGQAAYGKLCTPVLAIFAEPSSCNNSAGWRAFATTTTSDLLAFNVKGSTHCDGENAARSLCGSFCGGAASPDRQAAYAHYATAFLLAHLASDAAAASALVAAVVDADAELANVAHGVSTCAKPPPDAGATTPEGGTTSSSSGGASSGGASSGGAPPAAETPGPAPAAQSGCGCRAARPSFAGPSAALLVIALATFLARRRRR